MKMRHVDPVRDLGRGMLVRQLDDGSYALEDGWGEKIVPGAWKCIFRAGEGIALAIDDCRAYYFDFTGRLIQEGDWLYAGCFSEGLAVCGGGDGLRYFDQTGRVVLRLDARWREARGFHEGLAAVAEGPPHRPSWGYIDRRGELVIEPKWEMAGDFAGGVAVVGRSRRFGVIDRSGCEIHGADMEVYPTEKQLEEMRGGSSNGR